MTCKQAFIHRHAPNHKLKRLPKPMTAISHRDWDQRNNYVVDWWKSLGYNERIYLGRVPEWLRIIP